MTTYIIGRVLATIPALIVVSLVVFFMLRLAPGDPAVIIAGPFATAAMVEQVREEMGLNRPLPVQLGVWYADIFRGDLGSSLFGGSEVVDLIRARIVPTMALALLSEAFAVMFAVPLGIIAAWKANTLIDRSIMVFATLGYTIPLFWLGLLLIKLLAVQLDLFPAAGYVKPQEDLAGFFYRLALPVLATGLVVMALIARMTRAMMLEALREDYIRTARAKGLADGVVLIRHALRNAILPIITVIGLGFALLLGGVVVTENVFAIPGLGRLLVTSIYHRDYPVIQGTILVVSAIYAFVNLLVDISYGYLDPRIRY